MIKNGLVHMLLLTVGWAFCLQQFSSSLAFSYVDSILRRQDPRSKCSSSLCLCHVCWHPISCSKSADQAQDQCGWGLHKGMEKRKSDSLVPLLQHFNMRINQYICLIYSYYHLCMWIGSKGKNIVNKSHTGHNKVRIFYR